MTKRQVLDINNSVREFIKFYSIKNKTKLNIQIGLNHMRYFLLSFENDPQMVFFKFSRNPYYMSDVGKAETINYAVVKKLASLYNEGRLKYLYFATEQGYYYEISLKDFLKLGYFEVEQRKEKRQKYVISYKNLRRYK